MSTCSNVVPAPRRRIEKGLSSEIAAIGSIDLAPTVSWLPFTEYRPSFYRETAAVHMPPPAIGPRGEEGQWEYCSPVYLGTRGAGSCFGERDCVARASWVIGLFAAVSPFETPRPLARLLRRHA